MTRFNIHVLNNLWRIAHQSAVNPLAGCWFLAILGLLLSFVLLMAKL